jgi:cytoskeletal protein RodZ
LSLEQAAADAGIPTQYLRLLEGDVDVRVGVSDELYLIPFFRKYARFVGIDAEEMLPEFLGMVQQMPGDGSPPIRLSYRSRYASLWRPLAVLFTIGVAALLLLRQPRERSAFEDVGSEGNPVAVEPTTVVDVTPIVEPAAVVATPIAPVEVAAPTPIAGGHDLKIDAKEDAWLALGLNDQPAKQYLLRAGESRTWSAESFSLTVGNAGGVVLSLDGRELPPIGRPGKLVRDFRLPEAAPAPSPTAS